MDSQDYWKAIDLLAQTYKLSLTRLAITAGLDPTSLSHSKRVLENGKDRWLSTGTIAKILKVLDVSFIEFAEIVHSLSESQKVYRLPLYSWNRVSQVSIIDEPAQCQRQMTIVGVNSSALVDHFAVEGPDDERWQPLLSKGQVLLADRYKSVDGNDLTLIRLKSADLHFGLLRKRTAVRISLCGLSDTNSAVDIDCRTISWMVKVVGFIPSYIAKVTEVTYRVEN